MLERLSKELGITVIVVEHRLEELFDKADRIVFMQEGKIAYDGKSREVIHQVFKQQDTSFLPYIPAISQMYLEMEHSPTVNQIPLNVNEGKAWLASLPAMDQMIKKKTENQLRIRSQSLS